MQGAVSYCELFVIYCVNTKLYLVRSKSGVNRRIQGKPPLLYVNPWRLHSDLCSTLPCRTRVCLDVSRLMPQYITSYVDSLANISLTASNWRWNQTRMLTERHFCRRPPDITDILRVAVLRKRAMVLFFVWFSVSICYYGISYFVPNLFGDRHLNFVLGGGIELAAYLLAFVVLGGFGRRIPLCVYLFLSGIICIIMVVIRNFLSLEVKDGHRFWINHNPFMFGFIYTINTRI